MIIVYLTGNLKQNNAPIAWCLKKMSSKQFSKNLIGMLSISNKREQTVQFNLSGVRGGAAEELLNI